MSQSQTEDPHAPAASLPVALVFRFPVLPPPSRLRVVGRFNGTDVQLFALFCETSVLNIIKMILILVMHPRTPVAEGRGTPSRGSFAALCK